MHWEGLEKPVQVVYREARLAVETLELDAGKDPLPQLNERMKQQYQHMDLRRAPLLQVKLSRELDQSKHYALLQLHHIVDDVTSLQILTTEALQFLAGRAREDRKKVPYRDFVMHSLFRAEARERQAEEFSVQGSVP